MAADLLRAARENSISHGLRNSAASSSSARDDRHPALPKIRLSLIERCFQRVKPLLLVEKQERATDHIAFVTVVARRDLLADQVFEFGRERYDHDGTYRSPARR